MTTRIFWKILVAFFLAFTVQLTAYSALFFFIFPATPKVELEDYQKAQSVMLSVAAAGLEQELIKPEDSRFFHGATAPLVVRQLAAAGPVGAVVAPSRVVTTMEGARYLVSPRNPPPLKQRFDQVPAWVYVNAFGILGALIFAGGLALYLSRPIELLRRGLAAFAAGDLSIRLGMDKRSDEIADLARDFDGMADRIERLVRAREQLIADVSHELRTPLTRLRLAIALAQQKPERTAAAIARVEREISRLDEIVGELLTLSRLESGAVDAQSWFDLAELTRMLVSDSGLESGSVRIRFHELAEPGCPPDNSIRGDAELIRRAVENIVRNAIRYSPEGGAIIVTVAHGTDSATITVEDEGPGAPEAQLRAMFEPFVRGAGGAYGLGLAIARRAVLAHGGSIAAHNRVPTGLSVTIRLPTEGMEA